MCLEGVGVDVVAGKLCTTSKRVSMRVRHFELHGLEEKPGCGRKPYIPTKKIERIVTEVMRPLPNGRRFSVLSMSRHAGLPASSLQRVWSKNDSKLHITRTFRLSNDPDFERKLWNVVNLYLNPPVNALVLCALAARDALAAPRRRKTFQAVTSDVEKVISGAGAAKLASTAYRNGFCELFRPCTALGLLGAETLAG